jgi:hypothetical protein
VARGPFSDGLLAPLDAARSAALRRAGPWLGPFFADRDRRVLWLGLSSVAVAFVATGAAPLWLLLLGPLLLGVPHLLSDVRYLVVRPGLHRDGWLMVGLGAPLLAVTLGANPAVGVLAAVPAVLSAPRSRRRAPALAVAGALAVAAWANADGFQLIFVHAHNLVALALWFFLRSRPASHAWVPLAALAGSGLALAGALDPLVTRFGGWSAPATGLDFGELVVSHADGLEPTLAARAVLSFCFLQSVHYAVWLRLIPEDARPRRAPRPFAASWRALVHDFGAPALAAVAALAVGLAAWGLLAPGPARDGYLRLATFHGYLELAVAARWLSQGRLA